MDELWGNFWIKKGRFIRKSLRKGFEYGFLKNIAVYEKNVI